MNIVLHEPEIPQNAGNIARTCSVTNTVLVSFFPMRHFSQSLYFAPESFRNPDTVSSGTARMLKSK